jgi:hypothetical protein
MDQVDVEIAGSLRRNKGLVQLSLILWKPSTKAWYRIMQAASHHPSLRVLNLSIESEEVEDDLKADGAVQNKGRSESVLGDQASVGDVL